MNDQPIKMLLVEDDEDDYVIVLEHLCHVPSRKFDLEWICTYPEAVVEIAKKRHDIYIFDYRLGLDNGIDLIGEAKARGCTAPIIMLTRYCDRFLEHKARAAGATDFLLKSAANAATLEAAILKALGQTLPPAALSTPPPLQPPPQIQP